MFTNSSMDLKLQQAFQNCQSGNNDVRKQGEQEIQQLQQDQQYPLYLFNFITQAEASEAQLRAAIEFKQWFQKYTQLDEYQAQYLQEVVNSVKDQILESFVDISMKSKIVGFKLEEAIVFLAEREFPQNWQDFTKKLAGHLANTFNSQSNIELSINLLKLFKKITKKYEHQLRSDKLYIEIIHVCDELHDTFFAMTQKTLEMLQQGNNQQGASQGMISLVKLLKNLMIIFYHLNFQDLHPKFEDNLHNWMQLIAAVLRLNIQPTQLNNNDVVLFKCKGEALRGILLYATKYREEFMGLIKEFSSEIWNMSTLTGADPKFDKIVLNSLRYFKSLILSPEFKDFFQQNINQLLTSLIIPNLGVSTNDKEFFNTDHDSFIQGYFEQSDVHSRRSTTVDLLKSLCRNYKVEMQDFIQKTIPTYITKLTQNGGPSIDEEIILINLVIDGSTVSYRPKDGVTDVSLGPELVTYFYNNVIKVTLQQMVAHVTGSNDTKVEQKFQPIFVVFYLRFFFYFRHYIPKGEILEIAKIVSYFTKTESEGLKDISYFTIEMLLNLREGDMKTYTNLKPYFNKDNVEPQIQQILQNIYLNMKNDDISNYSLRAIIVILQILRENVVKYIDALSDLYKDQLQKCSKGYDFQTSQLIFDGIGMLIYYTQLGDKSKISVIEGMVSNELNTILQNSKQMSDLFSFVLQIYSLFVQHNNGTIGQNYKVFFESMMQSTNWVQDNQSLFQAYVAYINAYVNANNQALYDNIANFQTILTSLVQLKYDQIFFQLSDIVCERLSLDQLRQSNLLKFILENAFNFYNSVAEQQQQQSSAQKPRGRRTANKPLFIKEFVVFVSRLIVKHTATEVMKDFNTVQQNSLVSLLVNEIQLIKLVQVKADRKIIFMALTDLLLNNVSSLNQEQWALLLNAIIENCGNKQNSFKGIQLQFSKISTLNSASDSGFQKLQAIKWTDSHSVAQSLSQVQDEDKYFGEKFTQFYKNPQIQQALNFSTLLSQKNQETLTKLMQQS